MLPFFHVERTCRDTCARAGILRTRHGEVSTPVFLPVGSQGTVKALSPHEMDSLRVQMVLANTYHLYLRPGIETICRLGGLHRFMSWDRPILTDSGGFQVFSLAHLRRVNDEGVTFRSHIDGSERFLSPELVIELQQQMGADVIMVLDECPAYGEDLKVVRRATERTHGWAERSVRKHSEESQALFGIVQGGTSAELRRHSAAFLSSLDFAGYAIGGLSVGEPKEVMHRMLGESVPLLPSEKPRYLMGVGSPEDLVECVAQGIDMFDSALPTRVARNGALFGEECRHNIANARFKEKAGPVDPGCDCYTCRNFSAGYLHHLFECRELLAYRLATIHNMRFVMNLMDRIRMAILEDRFASFKAEFVSRYVPTDAEARAEQKRKWLRSRERDRSPG